MELVRHVISAKAKVGQVGATQGTGLGGKPTHFAVLKDFVFQQKLKPKYAKKFFEKSCKNRQEPQK